MLLFQQVCRTVVIWQHVSRNGFVFYLTKLCVHWNKEQWWWDKEVDMREYERIKGTQECERSEK